MALRDWSPRVQRDDSAMEAHRDEETGLDPEKEPLLDAADCADRETPQVVEMGGGDIVQFSAPMYYCDEDEGEMVVDIIRLGPAHGAVAVQFCTEEVSAAAGVHFKSVSRRVVMADGEHESSVKIPIIVDDKWGPSRDFSIRLQKPENCHLGLYLWRSRVKIIEESRFPSDSFPDEIDKGEKAIQEINDWGLFREYCALNYSHAGVKWQTWLTLLFDQFHALVLLGSLWVGVYIVDTIFARGGASSDRLLLPRRFDTAVLIAAWYVLPQLFLYLLDVVKSWIDIKGISRAFLHVSLMQSFLECTEESRDRLTPGEFGVAVEMSAEQVAAGYVALLSCFGFMFKIVIVCLFIVFFQHDGFALYSVIIMVTILLVFNIARVPVSQRLQKKVDEKMTFMAMLTMEAGNKIRLFTGYSKRPLMMEMFVLAVGGYNEERVPEEMVRISNQYFTKILSGCFIAMYIVVKTPAVLNNELSLGVFLATIAIFGTYLTDAITDLNSQLMIIVDSFVPLKDFTTFLNLPLELSHLKRVNRERRRRTKTLREAVFASSDDIAAAPSFSGHFKTDSLPIEITNLTFTREVGGDVLRDVNLVIPQGRMVAVMGPHNSGKRTFADLLSNVYAPTSGSVFVPSHLRVLQVTREPMFLRASMLHNLTLGVPTHQKIDDDRIRSILLRLDMKDIAEDIDSEMRVLGGVNKNDVADILEEEMRCCMESHKEWEHTMTQSRKMKLHIARALIANPEVMILQRVLEGFNEHAASEMIEVLRLHVNEKGLCMPVEDRASRRPRTVFVITESNAQAMKADIILQVDNKNVVEIAADSLR